MSGELFQIVILAGGLATRLRPLTNTMPKSLIDVNGEPFIAHQLRLLQRQGFQEIILCVGYLGEQVREVIGNGQSYGLHVTYSFDGDSLLGTAGAISRAMPLLKESFFVLYGDSYLQCDYRAVQAVYDEYQKLALMTVLHNQDQWDTSNVEFVDGQITAYNKKNTTKNMHYIDYGLGIFNKQAFHSVPSDVPFDLAELYQNLLAKQQLSAFEVHKRFYEVGSLRGMQEFKEYLSSQK